MKRVRPLLLIIFFAGIVVCDTGIDKIKYDNPSQQIGVPVVTGTTPTANTMPTWTWTAVTGAVKYRYGFSEGAWVTESATATSYTPAVPLTYGDYTLYVQAGDASGYWSASGSFTITISSSAPAPEINITQGTTNIASGGIYDFGSTTATPVTFTIQNTGTGNLTINTVLMTTGNVSDFIVNTAGMISSVSGGSSTTFTLTFNPTTAGPKSATLNISNSDFNEGTYSVTMTGYTFYPVADTGQTQCSSGANGDGALASCPQTVSGQDGDYINKPNARSFTGPTQHGTYTSDHTTKDNVTGLIWKTCSEGQTGPTCTGTASKDTWDNALTVCIALNSANSGSGYAGRKDWRLPSYYELTTIVNYGVVNPAIDVSYFPGTQSYVYWTSSDAVFNSSFAWFVFFTNGTLDNSYYKTNTFNIRCVAGP